MSGEKGKVKCKRRGVVQEERKRKSWRNEVNSRGEEEEDLDERGKSSVH